MDIKLHKQAAITPKSRAEIQAAPISISDSELARQYSVSDATIRCWHYRDDAHDRPHTRHNLLATRRYESGEDLEQMLKRYCWLYNQHIPQKALRHQSPIAAMKNGRPNGLGYLPNG